jgi:CheY-like chemotaxis protein
MTNPERRLRILVVDDHDVVHWGFRLLLTQQPWVERCLSARTGAEALALTRRFEPHVALVDLFVGEESGAEICEMLRPRDAAADGAAHLGRGAYLDERRARRGRVGVRVQGLAERGDCRGGPRGGPRGEGLIARARARRHGADRARA